MKMRVVAPGMGPGMGPNGAGFNQGESPFGQTPFGNGPQSHQQGDDVIEGEYTDNTTNDRDKRLK